MRTVDAMGSKVHARPAHALGRARIFFASKPRGATRPADLTLFSDAVGPLRGKTDWNHMRPYERRHHKHSIRHRNPRTVIYYNKRDISRSVRTPFITITSTQNAPRKLPS